MVLTEVLGPDGLMAHVQIDETVMFTLEGLSYPVKVVTTDGEGTVIRERTIKDEDAAIDDPALLAAEMRSELLLRQKADPEGAAKVIAFLRGIVDDPGAEEMDRVFHQAVLKGVER